MDMYSKMNGSAPVSSAVDGVWGIQKKGGIDDQRKGKSKKNREKKEEEEEFEDGLVLRQKDAITSEATKVDKGGTEGDPKNKDHSTTTRKIDIVI